MSLLENIRRRLTHQLESHTVDDDYTTSCNRSPSSHTMSSFRVNPEIPPDPSSLPPPSFEQSRVQHVTDPYDPDELVPSYESSQLLHEQQQRELTDLTRPLSQSIPTSSNVSRSNSLMLNPRSASLSNLRNTFINNLHHSHQLHQQNSRPSSIRRLNSNHSLRDPNTLDPSSDEDPNNDTNWNHQSIRKNNGKRSLKKIGLKFLNARQHFLLACCRDLSLAPPVIGLIQLWRRSFFNSAPINLSSSLSNSDQKIIAITTARSSEHFLTGVWCLVAGYLLYQVLDGLMVRWIVTYSTAAAIVRMLSMSTIIITIEQYLVASLSAEGYKYGLHIWILISCCLTLAYIVQNFVTSNLDLKGKRRARFFDFYNIVVFAVVPIGLASFITMIGLLRSLLILRLDIEQQKLKYSKN